MRSEESTTRDLVELVRSRSEASNRRDMDALMSLFTPDGIYDTSPSGLGVYEGRAAIRAFIGEWWEAFDELHFEPEEVLDLGSGVTFSVIRQDARPAGSAGRVRTREAHVIEWVGAAAARVTVYQDIDEARAAAERLANERGEAVPQDHVDENVRFVLAAYEWSNRERKFARDWWHDDGEWINAREDPDHAIHRGAQAIEKLFASWMEAYPDLRVDPIEARASGNHVLVWTRFSGKGATSGISLDMEIAHVVTLEDGRVRRLEEYSDRTEALEALGLEG